MGRVKVRKWGPKAATVVSSSRGQPARSSMPTPYPAPGRPCTRGDITAAVLHDDLFLVRYDCTQLESCLDSRVLRTNLDPLLQQPLPAECQQVVKAKLMQVRWGPALRSRRVSGGWPDPPPPRPALQVYPGGLPEDQLRLIPSLAYLYSCAEIGQWHVTSKDTVVALLSPDGALENQTEVRAGGTGEGAL